MLEAGTAQVIARKRQGGGGLCLDGGKWPHPLARPRGADGTQKSKADVTHESKSSKVRRLSTFPAPAHPFIRRDPRAGRRRDARAVIKSPRWHSAARRARRCVFARASPSPTKERQTTGRSRTGATSSPASPSSREHGHRRAVRRRGDPDAVLWDRQFPLRLEPRHAPHGEREGRPERRALRPAGVRASPRQRACSPGGCGSTRAGASSRRSTPATTGSATPRWPTSPRRPERRTSGNGTRPGADEGRVGSSPGCTRALRSTSPSGRPRYEARPPSTTARSWRRTWPRGTPTAARWCTAAPRRRWPASPSA